MATRKHQSKRMLARHRKKLARKFKIDVQNKNKRTPKNVLLTDEEIEENKRIKSLEKARNKNYISKIDKETILIVSSIDPPNVDEIKKIGDAKIYLDTFSPHYKHFAKILNLPTIDTLESINYQFQLLTKSPYVRLFYKYHDCSDPVFQSIKLTISDRMNRSNLHMIIKDAESFFGKQELQLKLIIPEYSDSCDLIQVYQQEYQIKNRKSSVEKLIDIFKTIIYGGYRNIDGNMVFKNLNFTE